MLLALLGKIWKANGWAMAEMKHLTVAAWKALGGGSSGDPTPQDGAEESHPGGE